MDGLNAALPLVWVTRSAAGAARTAARLGEAGFEPLVAPLIATRPLATPPVDLDAFTALAFTSRAGVHAFVAWNGGHLDRALAAALVHSPAAARALAALAAADVLLAVQLGRVALAALSTECAAPLEATGFARRVVAERPDESSLVAALLGAGLDRR